MKNIIIAIILFPFFAIGQSSEYTIPICATISDTNIFPISVATSVAVDNGDGTETVTYTMSLEDQDGNAITPITWTDIDSIYENTQSLTSSFVRNDSLFFLDELGSENFVYYIETQIFQTCSAAALTSQSKIWVSENLSEGDGFGVNYNNDDSCPVQNDEFFTNAISSYAGSFNGATNRATGSFSRVGNGQNNTATGNQSGVFVGVRNTATNNRSVVAGGQDNSAGDADTGVLAGNQNTITGTSSDQSVIGGGLLNNVTGRRGGILSGNQNFMSGEFGVIGAGDRNVVSARASGVFSGVQNNESGLNSMIGAGLTNIGTGNNSFIGAGISNFSESQSNFIGAGNLNELRGSNSSISSGLRNISFAETSFIGSGSDNVIYQYSSSTTDENAIIVGSNNTIGDGAVSGNRNLIGSGAFNDITYGFQNFIAAGYDNNMLLNSDGSSAVNSSIVSGSDNNNFSGYYTTMGGKGNNARFACESVFGSGNVTWSDRPLVNSAFSVVQPQSTISGTVPIFTIGNAASGGDVNTHIGDESNALTILRNGWTQINTDLTTIKTESDVTPKSAFELEGEHTGLAGNAMRSGALIFLYTQAERDAIIAANLENGLIITCTDCNDNNGNATVIQMYQTSTATWINLF